MRMVRLTGLERDKIEGEYNDLVALIADLADILGNEQRIFQIIYDELLEIQERFGDERRTELLVGEVLSLEDEDLIEEEEVIISLTYNGYIKRIPSSEFRAQRRGGRGVQGMGVHDDDFIETLLTTSTHDNLLYFSNQGKVYRTKGYEIPEYGRTAKGLPIINLLNLDAGEKIQTIINLSGNKPVEGENLFFVTKLGTVKRTETTDFANIRQSGLRAINLNEGDELIKVVLTDGNKNIILGTHYGYSVSFNEQDVRKMGRTAAGVRGARLREDDFIVGMAILEEDTTVLVITEKGYGKRTSIDEYAIKGRGGKGIKTANITEKNGKLVGLRTVKEDDDIMIITDTGVMIRFHAKDVSQTGRATLGVRLMRLDDDSKVSTMAVVDPEEEELDMPEEEMVSKTDEQIKADMQQFATEIFEEEDKD